MICLDNVSMTFPDGVTALHPTSVSFSRGRFTVLLGASGAGKSTLLRCLNFLNKPTTGRISVDGLGELHNRKLLHEHRRRTGMIFQQHQLIRRHSVLQNVLMGRLGYHTTLRSLFPLPEKEQLIAMESIERVGLIDKAMERVDSLSGGQQQRVGIARALSQKPRLILADEPVASLDPATSNSVLSLLHTICKEDGITVVVSLHQVDLAQTYADRLIGLADGRIVFDGSPADLTTEILDDIYHNHKPQSGTAAGEPAAVSSNILHKLVTMEQ